MSSGAAARHRAGVHPREDAEKLLAKQRRELGVQAPGVNLTHAKDANVERGRGAGSNGTDVDASGWGSLEGKRIARASADARARARVPSTSNATPARATTFASARRRCHQYVLPNVERPEYRTFLSRM